MQFFLFCFMKSYPLKNMDYNNKKIAPSKTFAAGQFIFLIIYILRVKLYTMNID